MGLDGLQRLEIRGPSHILTMLEDCQLVLDRYYNPDIPERFFGRRLEVCQRTPRHLIVSYEFRNEPIYEYLEDLLRAYPMCWMKNTYMADDGSCGLWIARMVNDKLSIQRFEWKELCAEEMYNGEDFSMKN